MFAACKTEFQSELFKTYVMYISTIDDQRIYSFIYKCKQIYDMYEICNKYMMYETPKML